MRRTERRVIGVERLSGIFVSSYRASRDCPENWAARHRPRPLTSPCRRLIVARCGFVYCRQSERGMDNIRVIPGGLFCLVEKQLRFQFYESRIYLEQRHQYHYCHRKNQLSISLQEEIRWIFWQWRLYSAVSNVVDDGVES